MKHLTLTVIVVAGATLLAACGQRAEAPTAPPTAPVAVEAPPKVENAPKPVVKAKAAVSKKKVKAAKKAKKAKAPKAASKPIKRPTDPDAARRDCTPDALRLCASAIPAGRQSIIECMKRNRDKLRSSCSSHFS